MADTPMLKEIEPPQNLCAHILLRVATLRQRRARIRFGLETLACFLSGAVLVPVATYVGSELYTSGFYDYFSLLSSDRSLVLASWREFLYSLIESLPSMGLLLFILALGALVWSFRRLLLSGRTAFPRVRIFA